MLLKAAKNGDTVLTGEGGLRGFMQRLRERLSTGKLLRPDVEDDVLRIPVSEAKFRFPSPGYVCAILATLETFGLLLLLTSCLNLSALRTKIVRLSIRIYLRSLTFGILRALI